MSWWPDILVTSRCRYIVVHYTKYDSLDIILEIDS